MYKRRNNFRLNSYKYCTMHMYNCTYILYSRVEWFGEKMQHFLQYVVSNGCIGPHLQDFMSLCCLFTCRRASENCDFYLKISKFLFLFKIFKRCTWHKICSLACSKTKTEEKLKIKVFPCTDQKPFCPFLEIKKILHKFKFLISLIFCDRSFMYQEGFCK